MRSESHEPSSPVYLAPPDLMASAALALELKTVISDNFKKLSKTAA